MTHARRLNAYVNYVFADQRPVTLDDIVFPHRNTFSTWKIV